MNRRHSLKLMAAAAAQVTVSRCGAFSRRSFPIRSSGASAASGHRLRTGGFSDPVRTIDQPILIVGAGVAGLSAARSLAIAGQKDFVILDLEQQVGGNSRAGNGPHGSFPLGAHYLPIPDPADLELVAFLNECGVCIGRDDLTGLPLYNEEYLCGDPQERLFHRGSWRSGIRPADDPEAYQFARFDALVERCANARGKDDRWAFDIPVARSSQSQDMAEFRAFDQLSFSELLRREGITGEAIRWYLDYCCLDDYGATSDTVSAYAGLHYFAARRGVAANAGAGSVLTWPEGNAFLVEALARHSIDCFRGRQLTYAVRVSNDSVAVDVFDEVAGETLRYRAQQGILCVPGFVVDRLLGSHVSQGSGAIPYAPWVVVNLTLDRPPEERGGEPMAWDNVRYGSGSLGYVDSTHQRLDRVPGPILTHYRAITGATPAEARTLLHDRTPQALVEEALEELRVVHPDIDSRIVDAEVAVWGHGMAVPVPGLITGDLLKNRASPIGERLHFAHADLSGYSIFEEAFHHGQRAAQEVLNALRTGDARSGGTPLME